MGKHIKQSTGSLSITAEKDGRYEYCFSNQMSAIADKIVRCVCIIEPPPSLLIIYFSFNVHGVIYVGEGEDGALVNMP